MNQRRWTKVVAWVMVALMVLSLLPMAFIGFFAQ